MYGCVLSNSLSIPLLLIFISQYILLHINLKMFPCIHHFKSNTNTSNKTLFLAVRIDIDV